MQWENIRIYKGKLTKSNLCSKGLGRNGRPVRRLLCNRVRGDYSFEDGTEDEKGRQTREIFRSKTCGGKETVGH